MHPDPKCCEHSQELVEAHGWLARFQFDQEAGAHAGETREVVLAQPGGLARAAHDITDVGRRGNPSHIPEREDTAAPPIAQARTSRSGRARGIFRKAGISREIAQRTAATLNQVTAKGLMSQ